MSEGKGQRKPFTLGKRNAKWLTRQHGPMQEVIGKSVNEIRNRRMSYKPWFLQYGESKQRPSRVKKMLVAILQTFL